MKAKVISNFIDKHTHKLHEAGTFYEGDEERINELVEGEFVEKPKKATQKKIDQTKESE